MLLSSHFVLINTFRTYRMRVQALLEGLVVEGLASPVTDATHTLTDMEVKRCAAVIAAAFLNPSGFTAPGRVDSS